MSLINFYRYSSPLAFVGVLCFAGSQANADVPPPVDPEPSGGGGASVNSPAPVNLGDQLPFVPPGAENLPPIPPPANRNSHPMHPDQSVGNHPPDSWYQDMYDEIYDTYNQYSQVESWAFEQYRQTGYEEMWNIYIFAAYLRTYMTQYYWNAYGEDGAPVEFSWGHASRGDFNYGYYFYVRPVYIKFVQATDDYYSQYENSSSFNYRSYSGYLKPTFVDYHQFTRCNYGKNGKDARARDDDPTLSFEARAGISIALSDILH